MAIQKTGAMAGRVALRVVFQFAVCVFKHDIPVKPDQMLILRTAVGIVTSKAGSAVLSAHASLNMERVIREALVAQNAAALMALVAERIVAHTFRAPVFHLIV